MQNHNKFNTFTPKGFSETRPFMHLSKHVFRSQQLQKYLRYEAHFFKKQKSLKFDAGSKNAIKISETVMGFCR